MVEVTAEGTVRTIFPLTEEVESVEWMPGVIALLSAAQVEDLKKTGMVFKTIPVFQINHPVVLNNLLYVLKKHSMDFVEWGSIVSRIVLSV